MVIISRTGFFFLTLLLLKHVTHPEVFDDFCSTLVAKQTKRNSEIDIVCVCRFPGRFTEALNTIIVTREERSPGRRSFPTFTVTGAAGLATEVNAATSSVRHLLHGWREKKTIDTLQ